MMSAISYLHAHAKKSSDRLFCAFLNSSGEVIDSYTYRLIDTRTNCMASELWKAGKIEFSRPVLLVGTCGLKR
jgi:acyl-CoA synthetase (AMP-forming)/AMP-acid ligase II